MAEGSYGGYDYDFVEDLGQKYTCLVCQNVVRDPMLTDCCGQHYCQSCLEQCNRSSYVKECPHCRKKNYRTILDQPLQREIRELRIYCTNRSNRNCLWEGEVGKLPQHLESSCPQRESVCKHCGERYVGSKDAHMTTCAECTTRCPNGCGKQIKGKEIERHRKTCPQEEVECKLRGPNANGEIEICPWKMLQRQLQDHKQVCPFRQFECKFCKKVSTYVAITGETHTDVKPPRVPLDKAHYAECPNYYPLYCKNKCTAKALNRSDMNRHLKDECPLEPVRCERWEEGCREMIQRKNMAKHMKAYKKQHREYIWCSYVKKRDEVDDLRTEVTKTKEQLATTNSQLSSTSNELASTKDQLASQLSSARNELASTKEQLATTNHQLNELASTKDQLASQLSSASDELVSTKEQLATTNRQLSSARNELTAMRGELYDTKAALAAKTQELARKTEARRSASRARESTTKASATTAESTPESTTSKSRKSVDDREKRKSPKNSRCSTS